MFFLFTEKVTAFSRLDPSNLNEEKIVLFTDTLKPRILLRKGDVPSQTVVTDSNSLNNLLKQVTFMRMCIGHTDVGTQNPQYSSSCSVQIPNTLKAVRCTKCQDYRRQLKRKIDTKIKERKKAKELRGVKRKGKRLKKKVLCCTQGGNTFKFFVTLMNFF